MSLTPTFEFCSCDNAWLKQLVEDGGEVTVDEDVVCDHVVWNKLTLDQLLEKCERNQDKGERNHTTIQGQIILIVYCNLA